MKNVIDYINEAISMSVVSKTVKGLKKENPKLTPEELRDKVYSTLGTEAIAKDKRLVDYIDKLTDNDK